MDAFDGAEPILDDPYNYTEDVITAGRDSATAKSCSPSQRSQVEEEELYERARRSRIRLKSSIRTRKDEERHERRSKRHHEKRHRRTNHSKSSEPVDNPAAYDDTYLPNTSSAEYVDPDTAFRESLFDAMADDEGAVFWEGVYGQPIPFDKVPNVKDGPSGLEAMTEEEYVAHIRAEMYKKTHQHLLEEKARREEVKKKRAREAAEETRAAKEAEAFNRKMEESLRRGRERKSKLKLSQEWKGRWRDYEAAWDELGKSTTKIPWPVWSAAKADISKTEVEQFFLNAPTAGEPAKADLLKTLKMERVRWHPDKVQQKLGGQGADEKKIQGVTAVFQIIDRMWTELRERGQ